MESMIGCRLRVRALRYRARAQVDALAALKEVFAQEAVHLDRHDQARRLDALKVRVAQEVSDIQSIERAAAYGFNQAMLGIGLAKLVIGGLFVAATRSREHPLSTATQWAQSDFQRTATFGTVVVAVGSGGMPDDVTVISVSRQARESGRSESEIMSTLEVQGYRLMMSEIFPNVLNELKEKVLKGILALPVTASSLKRSYEDLPRT